MKTAFRLCWQCILFVVAVFYSSLIFGQNQISGKITDAVTGEPLPLVNVFFVGTTIGASTSADGIYNVSGFQSGKYDLVVSLIGYKRKQQSLEFNGQSRITLDFQLEADPVQLSEVTVKEDTAGWAQNYEIFKRHFLGRSDQSRKAIIENPRDIHLFFDKQTSTLVAHARKPIEIANQATGYRIHYYLDHFEYHFRSGLLNLYGFPVFENLSAKNTREKHRWDRRRLDLYNGSLMHFIRTWKVNKLIAEGYKVSRVFKIPNPRRPDETFLNRRIAELENKNNEANPLIRDSLRYYYKLKAMPLKIDSVANESLQGAELLDSKNELTQFTGALVVEYKEKEESSYALYSGRDFTVKQRSYLRIASPLKLYENGYFEDVHDLILEKYWAWTENTSTLLPLDYYPKID